MTESVDLLEDPHYELLPFASFDAQLELLPNGAAATVTCSPAKGIEATVEKAAKLAASGFRAIPHLSAHQTRDQAHLGELLDWLSEAGIDRAFVVGGDAAEPGDFHDGLSLLAAMKERGGGPTTIGIPCYPEGHHVIPDGNLWQALSDKQPYADYMATQLCFDPGAIVRFLREARSRGIDLPVRIGLPGPISLVKLIRIATQIGVADSARYLQKQHGLVGGVISGGFKPDPVFKEVSRSAAELGIVGLHLFTFNEVEMTLAWVERTQNKSHS